jgi:hypothetical protein
MALEVVADQIRFAYVQPRSGMIDAGARPGSLLFDGRFDGSYISGTARIFVWQCGVFTYRVDGGVSRDGTIITLKGSAPWVDRATCGTKGSTPDLLNFDLRSGAPVALRTASAEHHVDDASVTRDQVRSGTTTVTQTQVNNTVVVNLTNDAAEARGLIRMFSAVIEGQRKMAAADKGLDDVAKQSIDVLEARVKALRARFLDNTTELSRYSTSIKPNDPDLQITPRKASQIYPKIPFYIPGTPENGEFWIEPMVTDVGKLVFNLRFIDPKAENDKTRGTVQLTVSQAEMTQKALLQIVKWAKIAHDKHIRRNYTQRAACFPQDDCPAENGPKREGVASTEIDFKTYEDGSTAGRIQRNKGLYEDGYNISIDSALLLQACFNYILTEGKTDFEAGSRTGDQMKDLFKPDK